MGEHLRILGILINLLIGFFLIINLFRLTRAYSYSFLRSLLHYSVYYNVLVFFMLFAKYIDLNIEARILDGEISWSVILLLRVSAALIFLMFISFIKTITGLFEIKLKSAVTYTVYFCFILLAAGNLTALVFPQVYDIDKIISEYTGALVLLVFIAEFLILIFSFFVKRNLNNENKKMLCFGFSTSFILKYVIILLVVIFLPFIKQLDTGFHFIIAFFILVSVNVFPLLWLNIVFDRYIRKEINLIPDGGAFELIIRKNNITEREAEIIKLILQGKSNKEIKDVLFISLSTVRNHIYNIYQKLNIKNRFQLFSLLNPENKR